MDIIRKLARKNNDYNSSRPVTIAFLGDSVTHGCHEIYSDYHNVLHSEFRMKYVYHEYLKTIINTLFPSASVVMVNAGKNGDNAPGAYGRLERDVLSYHPDLTVICLGLNDVSKGSNAVNEYLDALREIFRTLCQNKIETIFMTPNMRAMNVNRHIKDPNILSVAKGISEADHAGALDYYIQQALVLCEKEGVKVCDCYNIWKTMYQQGIDTTSLLSNHLNHPTKELHWMFAYELFKTMLS